MNLETTIKNCKIGTILYYSKLMLVKISDNIFINENLLLTTENILSTIRNVNKIEEPIQTRVINANRNLLTNEERIYLKTLIEPFKIRVKTIEKVRYNNFYDYINIKIKSNEDFECEDFSLPYFDSGTMFNNLHYNKEYTLKELYL